jgi:dimethylargininase
LDGGDVLRWGRHLYIGRSARTNREGAAQLAAIAAARGYNTSEVTVDAGLHLKTGVTDLGDGRLIATAALAARFPSSEVVTVPGEEAYAANCLRVRDRLLIPEGCPRVRRDLGELGYEVVGVEMSEFRKMDGGLTCLSLVW